MYQVGLSFYEDLTATCVFQQLLDSWRLKVGQEEWEKQSQRKKDEKNKMEILLKSHLSNMPAPLSSCACMLEQ